MNISQQDLENRFNYHPPKDENVGRTHSEVRQYCLAVAERFNNILPPGREASLAVTKLEEAMFWANAAIARKI